MIQEWMEHKGSYGIYNVIDVVIIQPYQLFEDSEYMDSNGKLKVLPNHILHRIILIVFWSFEWSRKESFLTLKSGLINLKKQAFEQWAYKLYALLRVTDIFTSESSHRSRR
jgi:hypothetical protein